MSIRRMARITPKYAPNRVKEFNADAVQRESCSVNGKNSCASSHRTRGFSSQKVGHVIYTYCMRSFCSSLPFGFFAFFGFFTFFALFSSFGFVLLCEFFSKTFLNSPAPIGWSTGISTHTHTSSAQNRLHHLHYAIYTTISLQAKLIKDF